MTYVDLYDRSIYIAKRFPHSVAVNTCTVFARTVASVVPRPSGVISLVLPLPRSGSIIQENGQESDMYEAPQQRVLHIQL